MTSAKFKLTLLPGLVAICRLKNTAEIPAWALKGDFFSLTRTSDELSIVCSEDRLPQEDLVADKGWRCFKVQGPLPSVWSVSWLP